MLNEIRLLRILLIASFALANACGSGSSTGGTGGATAVGTGGSPRAGNGGTETLSGEGGSGGSKSSGAGGTATGTNDNTGGGSGGASGTSQCEVPTATSGIVGSWILQYASGVFVLYQFNNDASYSEAILLTPSATNWEV